MIKRINREIILKAGIALVIVILVLGVIDQAGYVFSGVYIVKGGTLEITQARTGSTVFIDNKRVGVVDETGTREFTGIKPGKRNIIVAHTDAWPWILDFEGYPGQTTTINPLQVNQESVKNVLADKTDPIRQRAKKEIENYREPTRIKPLVREEISVWVEGTYIFVQKHEEIRAVYSSHKPIQNVFWYGDRNDAIIVASQDKVFALDLRKSDTQNFLPIYSGSEPEAIADSIRSSEIFVKDGETYIAIEL